jgi:putative transposon-encoded protein
MKTKFQLTGFEMLEKIVADDKADSGRIYVPKSWKGKKVAIVRLE